MDRPELIASAAFQLGSAPTSAEARIIDDLLSGRPTAFEATARVRSTFLRWLVTTGETKRLIGLTGLRLDNVVLDGDLDLRAVSVDGALRFRRVTSSDDWWFDFASLTALILEGCEGEILRLAATKIGGALVVDSWEDRPSVFAEVNAEDALVGSHLEINDSEVGRSRRRHDPGRGSDEATGADIAPSPGDEPPAADQPSPSVVLDRASIGGSLFFTGSQARYGFRGREMRIEGSANMFGCRITAAGPEHALSLVRSQVGGSLFLHSPELALDRETEGFTVVDGGADLDGMQVGGRAMLDGIHLVGSPDSRHGLSCRLATIGDSLSLHEAIVSECILLSHTEIANDLELDGVYLEQPRVAPAATSPATADPAAERDATAPGPGGAPGASIELVRTRIGGMLRWRVLTERDAEVDLDLTDASVGFLSYSSIDSWPKASYLSGFRFDRIQSGFLPFRSERLARVGKRVFGWQPNERPTSRALGWLHDRLFAGDGTHLALLRTRTDQLYDRALYDRLAAALASHGRMADARRVLVASRDAHNWSRGWLRVALGLPYRLFTGNGYHPWWALAWALVFVALGAWIFGNAFDRDGLVPVDPTAVHQPFEPWVFSLDTLLPIVDLHQADSFEVIDEGRTVARVYQWIQIGLGWVIATTLGAAAANFVRRVERA